MFIPPNKPINPTVRKKRDFETFNNEQSDVSNKSQIKDSIFSERKTAGLTSKSKSQALKPAEPSIPKIRKKNTLNSGLPVSHFSSLADLQRVHGAEYLTYGKPLVFLRNEKSNLYVLARNYVMSWKAESNAELLHGGKSARDIDMVAGFIHPETLRPITIGNVSASTFSEDGNLIPVLLLLPGDNNANLRKEEDFSQLARCMYCFDIGQHVPLDRTIALALQKDLDADKAAIGINLAMHHATANNDTKQALYFLNRKGDPRAIWDGNHRSSLEEALTNNNAELVGAFLEKMSEADIEYLQDLIYPGQAHYPPYGQLVEKKIKDLLRDF